MGALRDFGFRFDKTKEFLGDDDRCEYDRQGEAELLRTTLTDPKQQARGNCGTRARKAPKREAKALNNPNPARSCKADIFVPWVTLLTEAGVNDQQSDRE